MLKHLNLIYGISDENKLVHISEVASGKKCNCKCPACNTPLIAKKGNIKIPHFAHESTETCEYGFETSLHMAAKEVLAKAKSMYLPEVTYEFKGLHRKKEICKGIEFCIDRVELESKTGSIVPDIILYSGDEKIFVEIFVTHKIDEYKYQKIKELNISTLEIDLSNYRNSITMNELEEMLIGNSKNKHWVYHSKEESYKQAIYQFAKKRRLYEDDDFFEELFTRGCPLRITKRSRYYCAIPEYCYDCKFCIERNDEAKYIFCTGEALIGDISDFNISLDDRIHECINWIEKIDMEFIDSDICPYCYGCLKRKESESEIFYNCLDCDFAGTYDKVTKKINIKTVGHKRKYDIS